MYRVGAALAALAVALVACSSKQVDTRFQPVAVAVAELGAIQQGRCAEVAAHFDAAVKGGLDAPGLCRAWRDYERVFGNYLAHGAPVSLRRGSVTVVRVPLTMAAAAGEFRVSYDPQGTIAGIFFLRSGVPVPG